MTTQESPQQAHPIQRTIVRFSPVVSIVGALFLLSITFFGLFLQQTERIESAPKSTESTSEAASQ